MMKFSSVAVLLILAPFIAGSSWPGSIARQRDPAQAHLSRESLRLLLPVRAVPSPTTPILHSEATAAGDEWLTLILGGVLVALQLRRTHKRARLSRLSF